MAVAEPYPNLDKTTVIYEETFNEYGLYARIYRHGIANFKTHYSAPYLHLYNDGEDESGYDDVVIVISPSTLTKLIEYLSDLVERDT